jgi:hypothetical protein
MGLNQHDCQINLGKIEHAKIAKSLKEDKPNVLMAMTDLGCLFPDEE